MAIGAIDVGTTGIKLAVYGLDGRPLFKAGREYPVSRRASAHEVEAAAIWETVRALLGQAARAVKDIRGIGVSSFGESFVLLDGADEPLLPTMLYTDPRGAEQCARLAAQLGETHIADITGVMPHEMYSLPKLIWVRENRPEIWKKARRVCLIEDYIVYKLTGTAQIDYALAARTMALDIQKRDWSEEILAAAGVPKEMFSRPVPPGASAGPIKGEIARQTGLPAQCEIVSCSHDQVAAAVGALVFGPGAAVDGAGTTQCVTPVFPQVQNKAVMYEGGYAIVPFAREGLYTCYAFTFTGGALVQWFTNTLAGGAKREGLSVHEALEADMPEGPSGILLLPHFAGAATPYMDTGSKGAIVGLSVESTLSEMYKAALEGVAYEMRVNIERLAEAGIAIKRLHATGGGAKSAKWLQIKADILGREIVSLGDSEAGIIGGCMLTGAAVGAFQSLEEAGARLVRKEAVFTPDMDMHARYEEHYRRYRELYKAVRPLVG